MINFDLFFVFGVSHAISVERGVCTFHELLKRQKILTVLTFG